MSASYAHLHVLLTGANRGIGRALLDELLERGVACVYAAVRDPGSLEGHAEFGRRVRVLPLDLNRPELIAAIPAQLPQLDLLINNAGTATASGYLSPGAAELAQAEMQTNYLGPLQLTQALVPLLRQSKAGGIINVSSIAGLANFPLIGPYSASKAALHFFTQGLRKELADSSVQVLGVYPGPVDTRMAAGMDMAKAQPADVARQILDAWQHSEDEVYPDGFSQAMVQIFREEPRALERAFASA